MLLGAFRRNVQKWRDDKPMLLHRFRKLCGNFLKPYDEFVFDFLTVDLLYAARWFFLRDIILLALILFVENALVFVASSIRLQHPEPLRDILVENINRKVPSTDGSTEDQYTSLYHIVHFGTWGILGKIANLNIAIWIILPVVMGHRGMVVLHRGVRTLQLVRFLRYFTFTLTIMPSPRGFECQKSRGYAKPEAPFSPDWWKKIFLLRTGGGCHDLLFSGHCVMYVLCGLTLWHLLNKKVWHRVVIAVPYIIILIQKAIQTISEQHHYTVDMVVALYMTLLVWYVPWAASISNVKNSSPPASPTTVFTAATLSNVYNSNNNNNNNPGSSSNSSYYYGGGLENPNSDSSIINIADTSDNNMEGSYEVSYGSKEA